MKKHQVVVANPTELEVTTRPDSKAARTLADWESTPRVITEEEEQLLDSVTVSPVAPHCLRALIATGNSLAACTIVGIDPSTPRKWKQRAGRSTHLLELSSSQQRAPKCEVPGGKHLTPNL